jgi:lipoyl(octanoyl) transferase
VDVILQAPMRYRFCDSVDYDEGLRLQAEAHAAVSAGEDGVVLALSHPPTFTLGRHASGAHLLWSEDQLAERGVRVVRTDRGGDVTYHGPEQLVVYPVLPVQRWGLGPRALVAAVEAAMLGLLAHYGIAGERLGGVPGVFAGGAKIGFVGMRIRQGVSQHGLALNLGGSLEPFSWMNPCGHAGLAVTSVEAITGQRPALADAGKVAFAALQAQLNVARPAAHEDSRVPGEGALPPLRGSGPER